MTETLAPPAGMLTVVPLAYSPKSVARRMGCSEREVLRLAAEDGVPLFVVDGEIRIARAWLTGFEWPDFPDEIAHA
ncbi:hypothetical protein [Arthrobacter sp. 2MCAF14]|uniref:hypothetical protein n=1 Tax=Arthrobacter sp. 2MCAF14 TaxID=3232982 RepID=UPI003F8E45A0